MPGFSKIHTATAIESGRETGANRSVRTYFLPEHLRLSPVRFSIYSIGLPIRYGQFRIYPCAMCTWARRHSHLLFWLLAASRRGVSGSCSLHYFLGAVLSAANCPFVAGCTTTCPRLAIFETPRILGNISFWFLRCWRPTRRAISVLAMKSKAQ